MMVFFHSGFAGTRKMPIGSEIHRLHMIRLILSGWLPQYIKRRIALW